MGCARARVAALGGGVCSVNLAPLIRMLASDNDGEALAAARALGRKLTADGKDFHWLADRVDGGGSPASSYGSMNWQRPDWARPPAPEVNKTVGLDAHTIYTMVRFVHDRAHHLPEQDSEWIAGLRARYRMQKKETRITIAEFKRIGTLFRSVADKSEFG
jgi:hypothetical protein